jgi:hypothetical protein
MRHELVLAMVLVWRASAWASPTGLEQIPTAQTLAPQQVNLSLQNGNQSVTSDPTLVDQPLLLYQSEVGIVPDVEGGVDVVPSKPPGAYLPEANVKWKFLDEDDLRPAFAIGASQLGVGFAPAYYAVMTKTVNYESLEYQKFRAHHRNIKLRGFRVHAGIEYDGYAPRALVGTDLEINDYLVLSSDWISGSPYNASLGGSVVFDANNSLTLAGLIANAGRDHDGLFVQYNLTFSW